MEKTIEYRLQENSKAIKRRTLGFCGKESFKSEEELAKILYAQNITHSLGEAVEQVRNFPDVLELALPTSIHALGIDHLRILRFKHPNSGVNDPVYKITIDRAARY